MLRLTGLMISIGLVDSLNPSTIVPALYLASADRPRRRVAEFTAAVFAVYLGGGALIALGPGQLIRSIVPHPAGEPRHIAEIVAGILLLVAAVLIWRRRARIASRGLPQARRARSSAVLGATITAVELPTAFPYFAAIAALVGSGLGPVSEFTLLLIFNVCFVLPLIGIVVLLSVSGARSERLLGRARRFLELRWPHILSILLMVVAGAAILIGASGLAAAGHGDIPEFMRHLRHFFHLRPR